MTPGRMVYLARRRLKLGLRHWIAERFVDRRIEAWRMAPGTPEAAVPVHLLCSKHDWRMALWMLASLHETTGLRWPLVIHEDGSLTEDQIGLFSHLFPGAKIVRRTEGDRFMEERLAEYPRCADYRRRMPHGLKSFDIPQMASSPRFLLLDPDVIFFATPKEIVDWAARPEDFSCWFNQDFQEPSPIPPSQAASELGVALWSQVNSGLCLLTRDSVTDLDAMENWLGHPALQDPTVQWRVEQTLLALSASRNAKGGTLPLTYEVSSAKWRKPQAIARHYVGCVRDRFLSEGVMQVAKNL